MKRIGVLATFLVSVLSACNKSPSGNEGSATTSAALASSPAAAASLAAPVVSGAAAAPLSGLDSCLVGSWKSSGFSIGRGRELRLSVLGQGTLTLDGDKLSAAWTFTRVGG